MPIKFGEIKFSDFDPCLTEKQLRILNQCNIVTIEDLCKINPATILRAKGSGVETLHNLYDWLHDWRGMAADLENIGLEYDGSMTSFYYLRSQDGRNI